MSAVSPQLPVDLVLVEGMTLTPQEFERAVLTNDRRQWELHQGSLREKPAMVLGHELAQDGLFYQLVAQLDAAQFRVRAGTGRVASSTSFFIPDLFILPTTHLLALAGQKWTFHAYREPLPLVVEIWSPSTGAYDIDTKLPEYRQRGDLEIWRLHLIERTLKIWRRRPDGEYDVVDFTGGVIELHALPGITVDLDALFGDDE